MTTIVIHPKGAKVITAFGEALSQAIRDSTDPNYTPAVPTKPRKAKVRLFGIPLGFGVPYEIPDDVDEDNPLHGTRIA